MSKIVISESELEKIVYESTISVINEGKWGKVALQGLGDAAVLALTGPGGLALKMIRDVKRRQSMADKMLQKERGTTNRKDLDKTNSAKTKQTKTKYVEEPEVDMDGRFQRYDNTNYPSYCNNFGRKDVLNGHIKACQDDLTTCKLYELVNGNGKMDDEKAIEISQYLTDRDKKFETGGNLVNEIAVVPAIRTGLAVARVGKRIKNATKNTPLLDKAKRQQFLENEVIPLTLRYLCQVLSIEKEDPMYEMITKKDTVNGIMNLLQKNIK